MDMGSAGLAASALPDAMAAAAREIDQALDQLLPAVEGDEARLYASMRYSTIGGGKRLRGFLVLEGARQFNVAREAALCVASAIEMISPTYSITVSPVAMWRKANTPLP